MNRRVIGAIVRKDLRVVLQNKGVVLPILLLPLILFVVLPLVVTLIPASLGNTASNSADLQELLAMISPGLRQQLAGLDLNQAAVLFFLVYMMAPLFLIVPIMVSSVIAADSFVGERERKTLEALLYTPATDAELLTGKLLAAWLPALAVSLLSYLFYGVISNFAVWPTFQRLLFPNAIWNVLVIWVAPAAAATSLATMILVSVRAKTFQDAYQTGSLVVLPVLMLLFGQLFGLMYFSVPLSLLLGVVLWLISLVLLAYGRRTLHRSELIARL